MTLRCPFCKREDYTKETLLIHLKRYHDFIPDVYDKLVELVAEKQEPSIPITKNQIEKIKEMVKDKTAEEILEEFAPKEFLISVIGKPIGPTDENKL